MNNGMIIDCLPCFSNKEEAMSGSEIIKSLKRLLNKKGQGIVEFALLCAFCAAIGLFARDVGFSEAFHESLESSKDDLYWAEIGMRPRNSYITYFRQWKWLSANDLRNIDNKERILADQKALVKIAETFLGRTENQVLSLMDYYSNSPDNNNQAPHIAAVKCINDGDGDNTGFSDILVPLSYTANTLNNHTIIDKNNGWVHFYANNNQNTVSYLTDKEGVVYDKFDPANPTYNANHSNLKTVATDRLFYSNDVLDTPAKVTLRLHYTEGKVDFVDVALRKAHNGGNLNPSNDKEAVASGLCLHVVESGYSEIPLNKQNQNAVTNYDVFYKDSIYY